MCFEKTILALHILIEEHLAMPDCCSNCVPVNQICHIEIPSGTTHSHHILQELNRKGKKAQLNNKINPQLQAKGKEVDPLKAQQQNKVHKLKQQPLYLLKEGNNKD